MIVIPLIAAAVLIAAFFALLVMAIACPAPAEVEEEPPQTWPGPDFGPWGKRS